MALRTMANLYCTPQDVYEYVGADSIQLREDDRNRATGQEITATADAAAAATTISVSALANALLRGTVLVFDAAQMANPVEATLSAAAAKDATSLTVVALGAAINNGARALDNGVNTWIAGMLLKATKYATAQVKRYCVHRYEDSDLAKSWSVNHWTTVIAARWMSKRRYQSSPQGIEDDYKEVLEELRQVQTGQLHVEDIGIRTSGWPFFVNTTLDDRYTFRKVRVEAPISEGTKTQFAQAVDWNSVFSFEY